MDSLDFWLRIKALMKSQNKKQQDIADKVDVSVGVLQGWIHNNRFPNALQVYKIAQALNTTVEYLVTGSICSTNSDKQLVDNVKARLDVIQANINEINKIL